MSVQDNYNAIKLAVADACDRAGRDPEDIKIVAVSKTVETPLIEEAIACGIHDFGENRTVLFKPREAAYPQEHWHFIGRIQTNKVKDFVGHAALVHSVASLHALQAIDKRAVAMGVVQDVLIEVNVSGEESKDGVAPADVPALLDGAAALCGVRVRGLMTMAPRANEREAHLAFGGLRDLRDGLKTRYQQTSNINLTELSMGMSEDYTIAIEEGATILRIGRYFWL
jgi:pyridoxal phosphate enzyme (YggS family)